jgi:hypothetical protein
MGVRKKLGSSCGLPFALIFDEPDNESNYITPQRPDSALAPSLSHTLALNN